RIWQSGIRVSSGAPTKSKSYAPTLENENPPNPLGVTRGVTRNKEPADRSAGFLCAASRRFLPLRCCDAFCEIHVDAVGERKHLLVRHFWMLPQQGFDYQVHDLGGP